MKLKTKEILAFIGIILIPWIILIVLWSCVVGCAFSKPDKYYDSKTETCDDTEYDCYDLRGIR